MKMSSGGYTLLEALIFLAVSGLLFAAIYPSFSGRDREVRFTQSVRELESKLTDVMNDVTTGYFPDATSKCQVNGSGRLMFPVGGNSNNTQQGTRRDCIFVGKVVSFGAPGDPTPTIEILTVIGERLNAAGRPSTTLAESEPVAVARTNNASENSALIDITETYPTTWGIPITRVMKLNNLNQAELNVTNLGAIGIMTRFSGSNVTSDTKSVEFYRISGTQQGNTRNSISSSIRNPNWNNANKGKFVVCMADGNAATDRKAAILINTDNSSIRTIFGNNINTELSPGLCG